MSGNTHALRATRHLSNSDGSIMPACQPHACWSPPCAVSCPAAGRPKRHALPCPAALCLHGYGCRVSHGLLRVDALRFDSEAKVTDVWTRRQLTQAGDSARARLVRQQPPLADHGGGAGGPVLATAQ